MMMSASRTTALGALALGAALSLVGPGCEKKEEAPLSPQEALVRRGRIVFQTNCGACHNASDPSKPGSIGPEIQGASLELLEARVLRAEYPAGYSPKRQTRSMPPLPQVKADIPALHAFLNSR